MPLTEPYQQIRHKKKLIDLIDRPQWTGTAPDGEPFIRQAEDTLIPDLISIVYLDGVCQFIIFDAKYYNLQLEHDKKLRGQPGIESITEHSIYKKAGSICPLRILPCPPFWAGISLPASEPLCVAAAAA